MSNSVPSPPYFSEMEQKGEEQLSRERRLWKEEVEERERGRWERVTQNRGCVPSTPQLHGLASSALCPMTRLFHLSEEIKSSGGRKRRESQNCGRALLPPSSFFNTPPFGSSRPLGSCTMCSIVASPPIPSRCSKRAVKTGVGRAERGKRRSDFQTPSPPPLPPPFNIAAGKRGRGGGSGREIRLLPPPPLPPLPSVDLACRKTFPPPLPPLCLSQ